MPEGSSAYKLYGGFVQPLGLNLWLLCKEMLCQVPPNIWRLINIRGLQATFFIWGKMLCCKNLLKKLHILATTVRKRPFQREIGCSCRIMSQGNAKRMISALFCHGGWVFRGERCRSSLWMIFSLCGRIITCWQLWQMNRDGIRVSFFKSFFALCEEFFCTVWKVFFALCEKVFCTVWRGFFALGEEVFFALCEKVFCTVWRVFLNCVKRLCLFYLGSWPSGVSTLFSK